MKRILLTFLIIMSVILFVACEGKAKGAENKYVMELEVGEDIRGKQTLVFTNGIKDGLDELKFHLYANAYREDATNKAYKNSLLKYGRIEIQSCKVGGAEAQHSISGDKNILTVKIPSMKMKKKTEVFLEYVVTVPQCNLRLGRFNDTVNMGNFYPVLAVYDNGWREDAFSLVGDPFYSEIADYEVTVKAPLTMELACGGNIVSRLIENGSRIMKISATGVRDFAMVGSAKFKLMTKSVGGTMLRYYYIKDAKASDTLNEAADAVRLFGEAFGKYPYESYSLVETAFAYGGMEYPMLSFISSSEPDKAKVAVHETAHQWWSVSVGSDSIRESFIDEGLATFCTNYYYLLKGEKQIFIDNHNKSKTDFQNFLKMKTMANASYVPRLDLSINEYTTNEYNMLCYEASGLMFKSVYDIAGQTGIEKSLQIFFEENKFKIADKEKLYSAFNKGCGRDVGRIFDSWISGATQTFYGY
ncbi:MAG: M1 family metallopeptidase [Clostridia bacterium]|nr:M1 family metallopeptidase [Clostridia bacterium]